jgi:hypothetical protein
MWLAPVAEEASEARPCGDRACQNDDCDRRAGSVSLSLCNTAERRHAAPTVKLWVRERPHAMASPDDARRGISNGAFAFSDEVAERECNAIMRRFRCSDVGGGVHGPAGPLLMPHTPIPLRTLGACQTPGPPCRHSPAPPAPAAAAASRRHQTTLPLRTPPPSAKPRCCVPQNPAWHQPRPRPPNHRLLLQ